MKQSIDKEYVYGLAAEVLKDIQYEESLDLIKLVNLAYDIDPIVVGYFENLAVIQAETKNLNIPELFTRLLFNFVFLDRFFREKYCKDIEPSLN